jgi:L-alanine-DL-glutamate epimerase-like enolase superfamily enzyme
VKETTMKITNIRTAKVSVPIRKAPVEVGGHTTCESVLVWLDTDEGVTGESCIWMAGRQYLDAYEAAVHAIVPHVVGTDLSKIDGLRDSIWRYLRYQLDTRGIGATAASVIDWACWDAVGKSRGESVSSLLGRKRDRIRASKSCSGGIEGLPIFEYSGRQIRRIEASSMKGRMRRSGCSAGTKLSSDRV